MSTHLEALETASAQLDKKRDRFIKFGAFHAFGGSVLLSHAVMLSASATESDNLRIASMVVVSAAGAFNLATATVNFTEASHQSRLIASNRLEILRLQQSELLRAE